MPLFFREMAEITPEDARSDRLAKIALILLIFGLFSGNLVSRTYPVDPFWVEIALVHMPLKVYYGHWLHEGRFALWIPHVSFGYPVAHTHGMFLYPPAVIFYVMSFLQAAIIYIIFHLIILALSSYRLMRCLGARPGGSFGGAASLILGGYVVANMGYMPVFSTLTWSPLIFLLVIRLFSGKLRLRLMLALAIVVAIQSLGGDLEAVCYQWLYIALSIVLARFFWKDTGKDGWNPIIVLLSGVIIGGLLVSVQLFFLFELFGQSERLAGWQLVSLKGKFLWAIGEYFLWGIRLLFPAPTLGHYSNVGFIAAAFGVLGWLKSDRKLRWLFTILLLFCFINAIPYVSPLQRIFSHLPILKGFRFPWRFLFFVQLTISVIASWGIDHFLERFSSRSRLPAWLPACLVLYGTVSLKIALTAGKPWISPALVLATAMVIGLIWLSKKEIGFRFVMGLILAILIADPLVASLKLLPKSPSNVMDPYPDVQKLYRENENGPYAYSRSIMFADKLDGRFFSGLEPAWGGYSPAFPYSVFIRRTIKFFSLMVPKSFVFDEQSGVLLKAHPYYQYFFQKDDFLEERALPWFDLAGVRYIMFRGANSKYADSESFGPGSHFQRIHKGEVAIFENKKAYPHAFVATRSKVFAGAREVYEFMGENPNLDYINTVMLESPAQVIPSLQADPGQYQPKISRYLPDLVEINVETYMPSYLVLTDSYYPGWFARVDGKEERIFPAYGAFRAVLISEGKHQVVFYYKPVGFRLGLWATMVFGFWTLGFGLWKAKIISGVQNNLKAPFLDKSDKSFG